MRDFEYIAPTTLEEALAALARHGGEAKLVAGGTDILGQMKKGVISPKFVISLGRIPGLEGIGGNEEGGVTIGACASLEDVANSPIVGEQYGLLATAAGQVGGVQVRNRGTIGGNLCNASSAADTVPPLLVLGATLSIASVRGERTVPLSAFFMGPNRTVLEGDEVLKAIRLPKVCASSGGAFLKLGRRRAMDISIACAAAYLTVEKGSAIVREVRVALGSVAPTPMLVDEVGDAMKGREFGPTVLEEAGRVAAAKAQPLSDIRASAEYRREMVGVLVRRVLAQAGDRALEAR